MKSREMLRIRGKQLQILYSIVLLVSVAMMNHFAWLQVAANCSFYYKTVLANVSVASGVWMTNDLNKFIAMLRHKSKPSIVDGTLLRAELPPRPNADIVALETPSAIWVIGQSTRSATEITSWINFAFRSTKRNATAIACNGIRPSLLACRSESTENLLRNHAFRHGLSVAGPPAIDILQEKPARWEADFVAALGTLTNHGCDCTTWKHTPDFSHFEWKAVQPSGQPPIGSVI